LNPPADDYGVIASHQPIELRRTLRFRPRGKDIFVQEKLQNTYSAAGAVAPGGVQGRNRILSVLGPAELSLIQPHIKDIPFAQGTVLQEQGEPIEQVFFPHTGMISLVAVMNDGEKSIETATVGREGTVGAMSGLGPRHAFNRAVVQVAGNMARIPTAKLQAAVKASPILRDVIVKYNEVLLAQIQQGAACNAFHEAEARLCRWLLQTRDRIDSDIIPLTQEFLSQMLGVRRTTVTLIARALQKRGLVRYRRGKIEIVDRAGLEKCACECYGTVRRQIEEYFPLANR
jgi:CRP-like cAMP-binding protein